MPDTPMQRLKRLLVPSVRPESRRIAEAALRSPAADTLWAITGGGKPITTTSSVIPRLKGAAATYAPWLDMVSIDPASLQNADSAENQRDALMYLSHEAGHRADFRRNDTPGRNAPFKLPAATSPLPSSQTKTGKMVQVSPKEWQMQSSYDPLVRQRDLINAARSKVDPYYQTSPKEGYAQAFASAMDILRNAPHLLQEGAGRGEYAEGLGVQEAITPGVGGIVEALLQEPKFKEHPLQRFYKRK